MSQGRPIPKYYYYLIAIGLLLAIGVHIDMLLNADIPDYIQRIAEAKSPPITYVITLGYTQTLIALSAFYVYKEIKSYRDKAAEFTSNLDRTLLRYLRFYFIFLIAGVACAILFNSLIPSQLSHYFLVPGAFFFFFLATAALLYNVPVDVLDAHDVIVDAAEEDGHQPIDISLEKTQEIQQIVEHYFKDERIFLNGDLTIGKAANQMGISIQELSRFVNEQQNLNFFEYVNYYRVEEAKVLMQNQNARQLLTLEGIGKKAGFNSRASFYRAFKKFNGLSPGEFFSKSA